MICNDLLTIIVEIRREECQDHVDEKSDVDYVGAIPRKFRILKVKAQPYWHNYCDEENTEHRVIVP